jgi:hypothetical protein
VVRVDSVDVDKKVKILDPVVIFSERVDELNHLWRPAFGEVPPVLLMNHSSTSSLGQKEPEDLPINRIDLDHPTGYDKVVFDLRGG